MARQKDTFLIARYLQTPADKRKTHIKGYITEQGNVSYNENVIFADKLRDRDITAEVIINLSKQVVVKCRFQDERLSFERLREYYQKQYPDQFKALGFFVEPPKPVAEKEVEADADGNVTVTE